MRPEHVALAAALAIGLVGAPAAAGNSADVELDVQSFSKLVETLDVTFEGEDAAEFRQFADQNQDGNVTQAEADALEAAIKENEASEDQLARTLVDGKPATSLKIKEYEIGGLVGATASTAPASFSSIVEYAFTPGAGPEHTVTLVEQEDEDDTEGHLVMTVTSPSGYVITSIEGTEFFVVASDKKSAMADVTPEEAAAEEDADIVITYAKASSSDGGKSPATGFAAAATALLGLAAFAQRRRDA